MQFTKFIVSGVFLLFISYFGYTVFLADDALVKRTVKTDLENGGYQIVTDRGDGSKIIETYQVDTNGSPLSHKLVMVGPDPNSEPVVMKSGSFEPKFKD